MPTDDELRNRLLDVIEDTHRAHLSKRFNGEYVPCECEGDGGDAYFDHLNKMLLDAASPLMAEAVAAERERCARSDVEAACEVMHDAYERAAATEGWETQERSRKPWADVPEANKATMRAAVGALLDWLRADREPEPLIECPHWSPGKITLRRGCTACAAAADREPEPATEAHDIKQRMPWPPHPEADYMLSCFECSCGWWGGTFIDRRGNEIQKAQRKAEADAHAAPATEEGSNR